MAESPVRLLVVGEQALARSGLAGVLAGHPDVLIVGQSAPDADLDVMLTATRPDVLLWELGGDPDSQLETLAERAGDLPPVVVLLPGPALYAEARRAGALGLVARDADGETLALAVRAARRGLRLTDAALDGAMPGTQSPALQPEAVELTARELEVLRLVAEGLANKAIAARLGISDHTVKFHLNSVLRKLGAQSRTEAVVRATRLGLLYL